MTQNFASHTLDSGDVFAARHLGVSLNSEDANDANDLAAMLAELGVTSLDALIDETVPASIRLPAPLALPTALSETDALSAIKKHADKNCLKQSMIGMGYADTVMPYVILRNVLENPGWYTAYTPYQPEISQGRLEALLNFQQMIIDLTGLPLANASLLDEATAAAEAMAMARRISTSASNVFFVDSGCFPQTIDVLQTRAHFFGFELRFGSPEDAAQQDCFGALFQNPNEAGEICDLSAPIAAVKAQGGIVAVACDLMALVLMKSPGEMGADIALGSSQRFGIPMGFGGPHAAFFATRDAHKRSIPGRLIGVSVDAKGKRALRMALQTREQHIRREKANSNICTAQVLLANLAGFFAVYHGPQGLRMIAERIAKLTALLNLGLQEAKITVITRHTFDTLRVDLGSSAQRVFDEAAAAGFNLRRVSDTVLSLSINEVTRCDDIFKLLQLLTGKSLSPENQRALLIRHELNVAVGRTSVRLVGLKPDLQSRQYRAESIETKIQQRGSLLPPDLMRQEAILRQPVFNTYHTEHAMLRYLKRLQNKDLALDHAMIPLGSCTMKLTSVSEMLPLSWPEFGRLHPFVPLAQAAGSVAMIRELEDALKVITGLDAVCMQPNSGAQGEYAGIVTIRRYHTSRGEAHRNICLIPKSAHGTNPATAQMCGLTIVSVDCDANGNVDVADFEAKAAANAANLACLMITYPSTHGVFEAAIQHLCAITHKHGGQVYMDGANLNAHIGLTSPAMIGADVTHMNLHKTFAIPHGGGGPGMGPIAMKAHLAPFMPGHRVQPTQSTQPVVKNNESAASAVSAAPWGSASILVIPWMYIVMMGGEGLTQATKIAILNANYIAARLAAHYPVLYTGEHGRVAHECILDMRPIKAKTGITETDIAKRLMDYGFHAPTVSFPVPGTLMIEPTESEPKAELDRFIDAMISIRHEIAKVESGQWSASDNPLKNAPHTEADLVEEPWSHAYSRREAVFPLPWVAENKFWPSVNRIDEVFGDRNLVCDCRT